MAYSTGLSCFFSLNRKMGQHIGDYCRLEEVCEKYIRQQHNSYNPIPVTRDGGFR